MRLIDIGDKDTNQPHIIPLWIPAGATVVVKNVDGDAVNHATHINGPRTRTTGNGAQTFTQGPVWLTSEGRTTLQITGGGY